MTSATDPETHILVKVSSEKIFYKDDMDEDKDAIKFPRIDILRAIGSAFTLGLSSTGFTRLSIFYALFSLPGFAIMICLIVGVAITKKIIGIVIVILVIHILNSAAYSFRLLIRHRMHEQYDKLNRIKKNIQADHEKTAEISAAVVYSYKRLYKLQRNNPNFKFELLSPEYEINLNNFWNKLVDKTDKITHKKISEAFKSIFEVKQNGFDLFYILCVQKKSKRTIIDVFMGFAIFFGIVISVFGHINITRLIENDFFGVVVRIALCQIVFSMLVISSFSVFNNPIADLCVIRRSSTWINIGSLYRGPKSDEFILNVFDINTLECFMECYYNLRRNFLAVVRPYEKPILFLLISGVFSSVVALGSGTLGWDKTNFFGEEFIAVLMIVIIVPVLLLMCSYIGFGMLFNDNHKKVAGALGTIRETIKELITLKERTYLTDDDKTERQKFLLKIVERDKVDLKAYEKKVNKIIRRLDEVAGEKYKFLGSVECSAETVNQIRIALTSIGTAAVVKFIDVMKKYW